MQYNKADYPQIRTDFRHLATILAKYWDLQTRTKLIPVRGKLNQIYDRPSNNGFL